jgi:hypothetical protein
VDTAPEREVDADGMGSLSHEEKKAAAILGHDHRGADPEEISSSSSATSTMQTPTTGDPSSLNRTHVEDPLVHSHIVNNPIASTIASHTSGWASFFSSRSLMVKSLGYGAGNAGLVEDSVKRDENGVEVMDLDLDDQVEDAPETERGRGVHKEGVSLPEPGLALQSTATTSGGSLAKVATTAGAESKINAMDPKAEITPAPSNAAGAKCDCGTANSTSTPPTLSPTPKKGNSVTSTPTFNLSPST